MGIIQRQAIKKSILQYGAVVIGFLATYFVYNKYNQFYGLSAFVIDGAVLIATFMTLGVSALPIRFFPKYNQTLESRNAFFTFLILCATLGICLTLSLFYIFREQLLPYLVNKDDVLFERFVLWSIPLAIIFAFKTILTNQITNYKRIVVNGFANSFFPKVVLPILILVSVYYSLSFKTYLIGVLLMFLLMVMILISYLLYLDKVRFKSFKKYVEKKDIKEMSVYAFYGLFGSLGTFLATKIDTLFVAKYVDVASSGTYKVMSYFATLLEVPYMAIIGIAAPIVSQKLKNNKVEEVDEIYKNSSRILLIIGFGVLLGIALNATDIFQIMPKKETTDVSMAFFVVFCLGSARLIDASTSINTQIIIYSKYFRFNFYTIIGLSAINITLNYLLVPQYGMRGVAIATLISIFLFNLVKIVYIKLRFGLWPFTKESLIIFLLGTGTFAVIFMIPIAFSPFVNILIRCMAIAILYLLPLYFLGYLDEIITNIWKQIRKLIGR